MTTCKGWVFGFCVVLLGTLSGCPGGAANTPAARTRCPNNFKECGTGCIPTDGHCCNAGSGGSSYCVSGACSLNTAGKCFTAAVGSAKASFCCSQSSDQGSIDCQPGQHHCGLGCRPEAESCCARTTDLCTPIAADAGGIEGGAGASASGGDTCYLIGASTCTAALSQCCHGLGASNYYYVNHTCDCNFKEGQACYASGNVSFYLNTECCATNGPSSAKGTVKAKCNAGSGICTSDAECPAGSKCDPVWDCQSNCRGVGETPSDKPCCDGLVVGTMGHNAGLCAVPSGEWCLTDGDCASNHCVAGVTDATCK